jgi:hypothetical protein
MDSLKCSIENTMSPGGRFAIFVDISVVLAALAGADPDNPDLDRG